MSSSITNEYFNYYKTYSEKYTNIVILMQVGSFYEIYSLDKKGYTNLEIIGNLLDILVTKKNKNVPNIDIKNPKMCGFPVHTSVDKIEKLINNGYTVIIVDQITKIARENKKNTKTITRKVTSILTSSTLINDKNKDNNIILSLYITEEHNVNYHDKLNIIDTKKKKISIGMSSIDVISGKCFSQESHGMDNLLVDDENQNYDDPIRFIEIMDPVEILIYSKINKEHLDEIIKRLNIFDLNYKIINDFSQDFIKPVYQNELLHKIYKNIPFLTPIEYFNLDKAQHATTSLVLLLQYIYKYDKNLLNNIHDPKNFFDSKYMIIGNNGLRQLNIIEDTNIDNKKNIKSLLDIVNDATTFIGKRYIKNKLVSPIIDIVELDRIYDLIDFMLNKNFINDIDIRLKNICDVEKLGKKIMIGSITPFELSKYFNSIIGIKMLIDFLGEYTIFDKYKLNDDIIKAINKLIKYQKKIFNMEELSKTNLNDIKKSFFNNGIYEDLDNIVVNISDGIDSMNELKNIFIKIINQGDKSISLKHNAKEGYYLTTSNKRCEKIIEYINKNSININDGKTIKIDDLKIIKNKSMSKIMIANIKQESNKIDDMKELMEEKLKQYYYENLQHIYFSYVSKFDKVIELVGFIDYIKTNAHVAIKNNYVRPKFGFEFMNSYVKCKKIRHPIIEKIIDHKYISHDIEIGTKETNGILLYGLNASGKSALMKALGMSIIMAQSGMFVPADEFIFYPYKALYTRIDGNDNLFRGLSSFANEMFELKTIINKASFNTLVIGDEICKGTEHISGTSIIAASIIKLTKKKSSFLFTTHLHELPKIKKIMELSNLKILHLAVKYDSVNDTIIYDRELKEGSGENIYGIQVANHIIRNNDFIELANSIKNEILENNDYLVNPKYSKYNKSVIMDECKICGEKNNIIYANLDTHHIIPQEEIKNNDKNNLIILCKKCHRKIHNEELFVDGYTMTNKGIIISRQ